MTKTRKPYAIAALLVFASLALAAVPAAGQLDERGRQGMALVFDSLDSILKDLQTYDFTSGVGALMRLHAYVFAHKENPQDRKETEAALLKFVQGSPAPGGLMAACRALRLIGGPDSVPVLAALVREPGATDPARYALERIPGAEADQALLAALDKTQGEVRRGIVFSLGERRSPAGVPALARLAGGKDAVLAADAIKALGKTGGPEAVKALTGSLGVSAPSLKSEVASALLLAAEGAVSAGDKASAAAVYDRIFAANISPVSRQAAFKGKIMAGPDPQDAVLKALAGKETLLYAPALASVPDYFGAAEISRVADLSAGLPEEARIQLTALLARYPPETVRSYLLTAAESPSLNVRLSALRSITAAGDGKSVAFLAAKAARATGAEQEAARDALARLKGVDIDRAVLDHLTKTSDDAVKAELVQAASARRIASAKPVLMALVMSGSPALKTRSAAALRTIAGQADIPGLLDLLGGLEDETARESMEDTIAAVARTNPRELARAGEVKSRFATEKNAKKRADLLRVLGKIGDDSALSLVRTAVDDPDATVVDATVRALADWPTIAARDDVFEIARASLALNHRVLAERAYIRMIGLEPYREPEALAADLLKVLSLSPRPEEKKLVLGMLGRFPCVTGLKTAESLLADPTVAAEAKVAADRIRRALK
jgi:HEAT repeat protein